MLKKSGCAIIFLLGLFTIGCASERFERGYEFKAPDGNLYTEDKEISITGKVIDLVELKYDSEVPVRLLRLRTENKKDYFVQLGPVWFLDHEEFEVDIDNMLQVTGCAPGHFMQVVYDKDQMKIVGCYPKGYENDFEFANMTGNLMTEDLALLMARKVDLNGKSITLRDDKGQPLWYGQGQTIGRQENMKKERAQQEEIQRKLKEAQKERAQKLHDETLHQKKQQGQLSKEQKLEKQKKNLEEQKSKEKEIKEQMAQDQEKLGKEVQNKMFEDQMRRGQDAIFKAMEEKRKQLSTPPGE